MNFFYLKNIIKSIVLFACFLTIPFAQAQVPAVQWDKTIGGNDWDELESLVRTQDGGYVLAGHSNSGISVYKSSNSKGLKDYWIVKLDANRNKVWDKTFGGSLDDQLYSMEQTADGGFILGGSSRSNISGDKTQNCNGYNDYWIIKIDSNGNKQWDKTFGSDNEDQLFSIIQTSDGGYLIGGMSSSSINYMKSEGHLGSSDYWVIKINSLGDKQWDKTLGGYNTDWLRNVIQTSDGGYIIGGMSLSPHWSGNKTSVNNGEYDYWIVKLDSNGTKLWDESFGGNDREIFSIVRQTPDGGFIIGGYSGSNISGDKTQAAKGEYDYWIVKTDSTANKQWDRTYGGNKHEWLYSLEVTSDGGFIMGGWSESGISGDKTGGNKGALLGRDFWVVRLNNDGTKKWDKTIGGTHDDELRSIRQSPDGGYILGGYSGSSIGADKSEYSFGVFDFWIVKLGPDQINSTTEQINSNQLSIYPNPTTLNFTLQLTTNQPAAATLTNSLGQQIETRTLKPQHGNITENFSTKGLAKGIYNLSVTTNQTRTVKKIVVQ